jgi:hypothetical protein
MIDGVRVTTNVKFSEIDIGKTCYLVMASFTLHLLQLSNTSSFNLINHSWFDFLLFKSELFNFTLLLECLLRRAT